MKKKRSSKKTKKNPCFPPKGKEDQGLKYQNSKACINAQIRDNPWMLEKDGEKLVGKGPLLDEIKKRKRKKKKQTKKRKQRGGKNNKNWLSKKIKNIKYSISGNGRKK